MLKKITLSLFAFLVLFASSSTLFAQSAHAQGLSGTWYNSSFQEYFTKVYDPNGAPPSEIFGERYTAAQVQWIIWSLAAQPLLWATNNDPTVIVCIMNGDLGECATVISGFLTSAVNGLIGYDINNTNLAQDKPDNLLQAVFEERSFSGIGYVKDRLRKFSIIPEAHAQTEGFGFGALSPIRNLWQGARDISYFLFVIVVIVFAFMIMFRVKISPQAVVTVQSALPKVVMALILVTFSYAIVGFLIDLVYVVTGIFALALNIGLGSSDPVQIYKFLTGEAFLAEIAGVQANFGIAAFMLIYLIAFLVMLFLSLATVFGILGPFFSPLYGLITLIAGLVLTLMLLWFALKITWMLLKATAYVYILTIAGPFLIAVGSLDTQGKIGFGQWIRALLSNLAIFPLVGLMFFFSLIFLLEAMAAFFGNNDYVVFISNLLGGNAGASGNLGGWTPPWLSMGVGVDIGGNALPLIFTIVSLIFVMAVPKLADTVKSLMSGRPVDLGIGEAFAPYTSAGRSLGKAGFGATGSHVSTQIDRLHPDSKVASFVARGVEGLTGGRAQTK